MRLNHTAPYLEAYGKTRIAQCGKIARRSPNVGDVRASSCYFEDVCWRFGQSGSGRLHGLVSGRLAYSLGRRSSMD